MYKNSINNCTLLLVFLYFFSNFFTIFIFVCAFLIPKLNYIIFVQIYKRHFLHLYIMLSHFLDYILLFNIPYWFITMHKFFLKFYSFCQKQWSMYTKKPLVTGLIIIFPLTSLLNVLVYILLMFCLVTLSNSLYTHYRVFCNFIIL